MQIWAAMTNMPQLCRAVTNAFRASSSWPEGRVLRESAGRFGALSREARSRALRASRDQRRPHAVTCRLSCWETGFTCVFPGPVLLALSAVEALVALVTGHVRLVAVGPVAFPAVRLAMVSVVRRLAVLAAIAAGRVARDDASRQATAA